MKKYFLILYLIFVSFAYSQSIYTKADVNICESKFEFAVYEKLADLPFSEIIIKIGRSFIGTKYTANSLEKGDEEKLVIHLSGLDCYTFLESCLVFARCIKLGKTTFEDFQNELTKIRYRKGVIDQYPSRLHYFSDWIYNMNRRKIIKDITKDIGGVPYDNKVNFMSTHASSYKKLGSDPKFIEKIAMIEEMISLRSYYYIPQNKIESVEENLISGDIIGITTNIDGLDIIHTGIAIRLDDGRIHLLHSSQTGKKVQITKRSLADYIKKNKRQTGIIVVRAIEPLN
ncbi:N-acetylmuramoyl-L-alanine amidase-like domain-containing protein [Bacteroidota bacterium]